MLAGLAALALAASPAQAAAERARFSFVVAGHIRGDRNGEIPPGVDELVSEIERLSPDLVFLTGDLIWGDIFREGPRTDAETLRADWERLDAVLARLSCPVHRVPGNHDISDATSRDVWIERYGDLDRSFEFQGSRFLLLCSAWLPPEGSEQRCPQSFIRGRQLTADQVDFVRREMDAASGADHVFVLMHHLLWWNEPSPPSPP
ncbi:MAG TPA: metallophosphoesterase, partial [Planctomycetota bacterium]|nr:metallophosphoesterase [Planctomycetota bacterium]